MKNRWTCAWIVAALVALLALVGGQPVAAAVCEDCPDGGGDGGGAGTRAPAPPDAAFQFKAPVIGCLPPDLLNYIRAKIKAEIRATLKREGETNPEPETRALCNQGRQTVAVWFKPLGGYGIADTEASRDARLQEIDLLRGKETMAVMLTHRGVNRRMAKQFAKRAHMDDSGDFDPEGPSHLTSYRFGFVSPTLPGPVLPGTPSGPLKPLFVKTIFNTKIEGYREAAPDIAFTVYTSDLLSVSGGKIGCDSDETEYDIHTTALDILQALTILLGQIVSPADIFLLEGFIIFTEDLPSLPGPGCALAAAFPSTIMIPGHRFVEKGGFLLRVADKLDPRYGRLQVDDHGLTAAGEFKQVARTPEVLINGPTRVRIEFGLGEVEASFTVKTKDLRDVRYLTNFLVPDEDRVVWHAPGATITHPHVCVARDDDGTCLEFKMNRKAATISWPIDPMTPITAKLNRTFSVEVVDADGLSAEASHLVRFEITRDPDLPPICDKHPERFECDLDG